MPRFANRSAKNYDAIVARKKAKLEELKRAERRTEISLRLVLHLGGLRGFSAAPSFPSAIFPKTNMATTVATETPTMISIFASMIFPFFDYSSSFRRGDLERVKHSRR